MPAVVLAAVDFWACTESVKWRSERKLKSAVFNTRLSKDRADEYQSPTEKNCTWPATRLLPQIFSESNLIFFWSSKSPWIPGKEKLERVSDVADWSSFKMTLKTGYKARHETYIFFSSFSIFFVPFFVSVSVSLRFGCCFVSSFFRFFFFFCLLVRFLYKPARQ